MPKKNARPRASAPERPCPCGSGGSYADCCGALHRSREAAPTAERLMRSRYSAFAVGDAEYLLRTWHPSTRPASLELDPRQRWTGLEILGGTGGGPFHTEGTVEFRARFTEGGRASSLHENSRFVRVEGLWTYLDALD
ncbi:YchJ family protein [Streptomyces thermolineatus]|uniref:YchJ family protein n=1 Tax=Streptomyces thermolineatus TaxID=44033 RepID=UPI00384F3973